EGLLLSSFQDDAATANYYRYMINHDSLQNSTRRDIVADDNYTNGQMVTFGGDYEYERGDTIVLTLYHIEKNYHDFLNSVSTARRSSGNPFGEASQVVSGLKGGIGILTNLAFDRRTIIID